MKMIKLVLKCPNCSNEMRYHTDDMILSGKRKRCVYCGKSFKVSENRLKIEY